MLDTGWRPGTLRDTIAREILSAEGNDSVALMNLRPLVGESLVFKTNQNGTRVALPLDIQRERFEGTYEDVRSILQRGGKLHSAPMAAVLTDPIPVKRESRSQRDAEEMIRWIQSDLRPLAHRVGPDGAQLDEIGLRPAENAARMMRAGIRVDAVKHALTLSYPPEARRALGVSDVDPSDFTPCQWDPVTAPDGVLDHSGEHAAMPYVMALASARVPIALVGPKGTGKTTLAKQLADRLGLSFGMASMTGGTPPGEFKGRPKVGGDGGFIRSQFERVYTDGGVYLFDEMDAADENLLLLVNAALANGHFVNGNAESVKRHENFIPVCGMNTLGLGQDRNYNGRTKLDAATLDRWNAGRVKVELDEQLERKVFWSIAVAS